MDKALPSVTYLRKLPQQTKYNAALSYHAQSAHNTHLPPALQRFYDVRPSPPLLPAVVAAHDTEAQPLPCCE